MTRESDPVELSNEILSELRDMNCNNKMMYNKDMSKIKWFELRTTTITITNTDNRFELSSKPLIIMAYRGSITFLPAQSLSMYGLNELSVFSSTSMRNHLRSSLILFRWWRCYQHQTLKKKQMRKTKRLPRTSLNTEEMLKDWCSSVREEVVLYIRLTC